MTKDRNQVWSDLFRIDLSEVETAEALRFAVNVFRILFQDSYALNDLHDFGRKHQIDTKTFARNLRSNGPLLKNAKLFLMYPQPTALAFGLSVKTARALTVLHKTRIGVVIRKLRNRYTVYDLEEFEKLLARTACSPSLQTSISKFVYKKMAFLIKSYGVSQHDLEADLLCEGLYALFRAYPRWENDLHASNICKTAIHNRGINLIKEHTSTSRNRLVKSGEGFESLSLYFSAFDTEEGVASLMSPSIETLSAVEDAYSVRQLLNTLPPRKKLFVSLLLGEFNSDFSKFLGEDNSDLCERSSIDSTLTKVCAYFGISKEKGQRVLTSLRSSLS